MSTIKTSVIAIVTKTRRIELEPGQAFCLSTRSKAWEIWQEEPLRRVHRIPIEQILWVIEKEQAP